MTQEQINSLLAKPATKSCAWTEDADGNWITGCQEIHVFISGTPQENGYVYCPYCGGGVQIRMTGDEVDASLDPRTMCCDSRPGNR